MRYFKMKFNNFVKALVIGMILTVTGCSDSNKESINGSINRLEREITVTVKTVKNEQELKKIYKELTGNNNPPDQYGFAQWNELADLSNGDVENPNCQIYIIQPNRKDDNNILTLGHEMAHCIWGSYHK